VLLPSLLKGALSELTLVVALDDANGDDANGSTIPECSYSFFSCADWSSDRGMGLKLVGDDDDVIGSFLKEDPGSVLSISSIDRFVDVFFLCNAGEDVCAGDLGE
jgi:hypothetical protein